MNATNLTKKFMASKLDCQLSEITYKSIICLLDLGTLQKIQTMESKLFGRKFCKS